MPKPLNHTEKKAELKRYLAQQGFASAPEICRQLGISQPVFSRLAISLGDELLKTGKARRIRYALRRPVAGEISGLPIYEIQEDGRSILFGTLQGTHPNGYYLDSSHPHLQSRFYPDLPYLLEDLRPSGFLGRLIPARHAELGFPNDIRLWSAEHCLQYWARYGWNLVGNLILGEPAFRLYLDQARATPEGVLEQERARRYPQLAQQILEHGIPGSSAAGEQPKFLTTRQNLDGSMNSVLVKFSPPTQDPVSQRIGDLLVCEHLALEVLRERGVVASRSTLVQADDRVFLEVERFDRREARGRRGLVSLRALDAEFVGSLESWTKTSLQLLRLKQLDAQTYDQVVRLEIFGKLIANTDMHLGNLSFLCCGERLLGLSPVYDMLPMLYAPLHQQLMDRTFVAPLPSPANGPLWQEAWLAACEFWSRAAIDPRISEAFRVICRANLSQVTALGEMQHLLP